MSVADKYGRWCNYLAQESLISMVLVKSTRHCRMTLPHEGETILNSGIIITVPIHKSDNGYPFAGAARTSGGPVWLLNGNLSRISYTPGDAVHIEGNVHLLTESPIPEGLSLTLSGQMIGDHTGVQVSTHGRFVSRLLTRTGLPIEINTHQDYPIFGDCSIENLVFQATGFEQVEHFSCNTRRHYFSPRY